MIDGGSFFVYSVTDSFVDLFELSKLGLDSLLPKLSTVRP